jgi:hypothetical protein
MMSQREIFQRLIRTVVAFCRLCEHVDADAREDLVDASAALVDIWVSDESNARPDAIRRWCHDAEGCLGRLDYQGHAFLRAQSRLLRLQASISSELQQPAKSPVSSVSEPKKRSPNHLAQATLRNLGKNQRLILQWLQQNPDARTRELTTHFAGKLSDRTVLRSLKELVSSGIVRRTQRDGSAVYETIDTEG